MRSWSDGRFLQAGSHVYWWCLFKFTMLLFLFNSIITEQLNILLQQSSHDYITTSYTYILWSHNNTTVCFKLKHQQHKNKEMKKLKSNVGGKLRHVMPLMIPLKSLALPWPWTMPSTSTCTASIDESLDLEWLLAISPHILTIITFRINVH